ncbi:MAG: nucleotidyltransferase domain-containing protein [Elainellaceae cyanobacterium]
MMLTQLDPKVQNRFSISNDDIATFCQHWEITHLALFGSVLRDDFKDESDIDLLIAFTPEARQGLLTLAKIKHELESLLKRPVDIVVKSSIESSENWIRRHEILGSAQTIYEQG